MTGSALVSFNLTLFHLLFPSGVLYDTWPTPCWYNLLLFIYMWQYTKLLPSAAALTGLHNLIDISQTK